MMKRIAAMQHSKIITKEEAEKLQLQPMGKKHPIRGKIEMLKVGQLLKVSRIDFRWKRHTPARFCRAIEKQGDKLFRVYKIGGDTGWVVERVK